MADASEVVVVVPGENGWTFAAGGIGDDHMLLYIGTRTRKFTVKVPLPIDGDELGPATTVVTEGW